MQPHDDPPRLTLNRDVRFRVVDDEAVVIRQDTNEILALNAVAARLLELIQAEQPFDQICATLLKEYAVEEEELVRDLRLCIADLTARGVLEEAGGETPSGDG